MKDFKIPTQGTWAQLPTPIQKLHKISAETGVELYIKRDDLTGFECSGNKIRKLNFLVQDALDKGATCLITCGGLQSNHCRATAALAARLGLRCVLLLRGEKPKEYSANYLLDHLFGAEIFYLSNEQYANQRDLLISIDSQMRKIGAKSYYIPEGGSNPLGSMGYLQAWQEIGEQIKNDSELSSGFNSIVCAHGSGGTQAGLVLGKIFYETELPVAKKVIGVNVCYDKIKSFQLVKDVLWGAIQGFHLPLSFLSDDIVILDGFLGRGYALHTKEELEFLARIARTEGILLDPTYSGKAFYGMVQTLKKQRDFFGEKILFLHTGGAFGNFKLQEEWKEIWEK